MRAAESTSCATSTTSASTAGSGGKKLSSEQHSEKQSDKMSEAERRIAGFSDIFLLSEYFISSSSCGTKSFFQIQI